MKSRLHFTPEETLFFQSITPTSTGAIFATCLMFFLISVGDRYLRAVCRGVERRFSQRTKQLTTYYHFANGSEQDGPSTSHASKTPAPEPNTHAAAARFVLSHELSRGALAGHQTTIHYLLMLVVIFVHSTFTAASIVSAILGVMVGETAFGRLNL
ncbi:Ctr copper transporter [Mycena leptocephala]|nr:Ctr copper transporter [Mycena leptocephala]